MKFSAVADSVTARALDAAWLYQALEPVSAFGRRMYEELAPFRPGEELLAQQHADRIAARAVSLPAERVTALRDALRASSDPLGALSRAALGETLDDAQLLEVLRFLDAARRLEAMPWDASVERLAGALEPGRAGKFGFYLSDEFTSNLARAREAAQRAQAAYESARGRLARSAGAALGRDDAGAGEFIVMRDEIASLPPGVRVVREAPTYFLCELELDEEALRALQRRDAALGALAAAEQHERVRLSAAVRDALPALEALLQAAATADVELAQVNFAQQYACRAQRVVAEARVTFENGAFLPMMLQLAAQGRAYERIGIDLREAAVITGPNMGGKSAALRTCGFMALLTAFGIPLPAENAACALFDDIAWIGVGAEDVPGSLLSSYASEVVRLRELLERPALRMLMLLDEFARTTTPNEGGALLAAVLRVLKRRGRLAFAATHVDGVAERADVAHYAVRGLRDVPPSAPAGDLSAALNALAACMDYSVVPIEGAGRKQSDALALAKLLGLDEEIVNEAKESAWIR